MLTKSERMWLIIMLCAIVLPWWITAGIVFFMLAHDVVYRLAVKFKLRRREQRELTESFRRGKVTDLRTYRQSKSKSL